VFKPFVALHAMQLSGGRIDPSFTHDCKVEEGELRAGWGGVACNSYWGHGELDMAGAIAVSCNSYFARLADELGTDEFEALGQHFGLGRPSGVVFEDAPVSRALELSPEPFRWDPGAGLPKQLRRAANGLQVVEVTPMQVARAMAGLATGRLPSMRLVDWRGDEQVPQPEPERLPYDEPLLDAVRAMMVDVTNAGDGSARRTLSRGRIGHTVAAKTGSADLQHRKVRGPDGQGEPLKHTWVAGWLPAEDPQLVFVVFLSATEVSSSKAAIFVAGQLLERPEVQALLSEGSR
ncbi:MAG: penicillin-binding transpeptidase domain-containing protein, partial [Planctomycetota bacterium]